MRQKLLLSTAIFLAGVGLASAQNSSPGGASGGSAGAAQHSGSSGAAQSQAAQPGAQSGSQTKASQGNEAQKSGQAQGQKEPSKQSQSQQREGQRDRTTGQAPSQKEQSKQAQPEKSQSKQSQQRQSPRDQTTGQGRPEAAQSGKRDQTPSQTQQHEGQQGQVQPGQERGQFQQDRASTGENAGRVTLSSEQRTHIRDTILNGRNVPRADNVNFSVRVGTAVPSTIRVVEVPQTLIEIYPEWRGDEYFVVRDEIIIVDRDRRIVSVLPAGSSSAEYGNGASSSSTMREESGGSVNLSEPEIRQLQTNLKEKGFTVVIDGRFGPGTRDALIQFQRREGFEANGRIDNRTISALGISGRSGQSPGQSTGPQGGMQGQGGMQNEQSGNQGRQSTTGQNGMQPSGGMNPGQSGSQGRQSTTGQGGMKPSTNSGATGGGAESGASGSMPSGGNK